MFTTLNVTAGSEEIERYRALLRGDWSRDTFDDIVSLLWRMVSVNAAPDTFGWWNVLAARVERKSAKDFDQEIIARIRELSLTLTEPGIPAMPDRFTATRPSRAAAQAEQAWAYLMIQAMATLQGEPGLFVDTQSLLYLCVCHSLLPLLKQQSLLAEHDCLVCALYIHSVLVWRRVPSHCFHLQSVLFDHLEQPQRRLELLRMAFDLTPLDDHSYLTRATAYWSELMEAERYPEASSFLSFLTRHAPDACQEEIREMMTETWTEACGEKQRA